MKLKSKNIVFDVNIKDNGNSIISTIDDNIYDLKYDNLEKNKVDIISNNHKKRVFYYKLKDKIFINIDGLTYEFEKIEDDFDFINENSQNKNIDIIKAPMPGSIIKVLVNKDDIIEEGQTLLIVEAMKMETSLYSSISGKITYIDALVGEQVNPDKELIRIEKL